MLREKNDTGYILSVELSVWRLEGVTDLNKKQMTNELMLRRLLRLPLTRPRNEECGFELIKTQPIFIMRSSFPRRWES